MKNYSRWLFYPINNLSLNEIFFLKIEGWDQKSEESEEKEQLMLYFILGFFYCLSCVKIITYVMIM